MNKNLKYILILFLLILTSCCGIIKSSSNKKVNEWIKFFKEAIPEDNSIEEYIEDKIEDMTSLDVDLTPESEECH